MVKASLSHNYLNKQKKKPTNFHIDNNCGIITTFELLSGSQSLSMNRLESPNIDLEQKNDPIVSKHPLTHVEPDPGVIHCRCPLAR